MLEEYFSVSKFAEINLEIKRSKFIGYASPVEDAKSALDFVEKIKDLHPAARHNCYAWVVGLKIKEERYSDDGEPHGTAGKPILECIANQGLIQTVVVVTRYFGGTLLGTGGLVRAYSESSILALKAAQPQRYQLMSRHLVEFDYPLLDQLKYQFEQSGFIMTNFTYKERVGAEIAARSKDEEQMLSLLRNISSNQFTSKALPPQYMIR